MQEAVPWPGFILQQRLVRTLRASGGRSALLLAALLCASCATLASRPLATDGRAQPARQPGPLMEEITRAGIDIDRGMVLKVRGQLYDGDAAMHAITLMSSGK